MNYGVEVTFKDGSKDWYDPIDKSKLLEELDNDDIGEVCIWVGAFDYWLDKDDIASYKFYVVGEE